MKKVLACALVAAMSTTLLAGCGNNGSTASSDSAAAGSSVAGSSVAGSSSTEVTDVALKVWVPQNQIDSGIIEEQQKAFAEAHPEWNITWTTAAVGEDTAYTEVSKTLQKQLMYFSMHLTRLQIL